jgi:hypothetical protein
MRLYPKPQIVASATDPVGQRYLDLAAQLKRQCHAEWQAARQKARVLERQKLREQQLVWEDRPQRIQQPLPPPPLPLQPHLPLPYWRLQRLTRHSSSANGEGDDHA